LLRGAFSSGVGEKKKKNKKYIDKTEGKRKKKNNEKKNPSHRKRTQHARLGRAEPARAHAVGERRLARSWQTKRNSIEKRHKKKKRGTMLF